LPLPAYLLAVIAVVYDYATVLGVQSQGLVERI
jgi:hypothetical protein